jgi:hypothetical protein
MAKIRAAKPVSAKPTLLVLGASLKSWGGEGGPKPSVLLASTAGFQSAALDHSALQVAPEVQSAQSTPGGPPLSLHAFRAIASAKADHFAY